ncbi:MAG: hypothetical protein M1835_004573 [Candelina submexicana]|nr:MAG: hypothetical protein M1835_004573 [Candelina submexicana]
MAKAMRSIASDCHPHTLMSTLARAYNLGGLFCIDAWPFAEEMVIVADPELAAQVTQTSPLAKHPQLGNVLRPIIGDKSILTTEGAEWKFWRSVFNPGFSSSHLMTLVPYFIDDGLVFCAKLTENVEKEHLFFLEEALTLLTVDVIGRVVLDTKLDSQRKEHNVEETNPLVTTKGQFLQSSCKVQPSTSRSLGVLWWHERVMNTYLDQQLDDRFTSWTIANREPGMRQKYIMNLALETYMEQQPQQKGAEISRQSSKNMQGLDKVFKRSAIDNQHPNALKKVQEEHDDVFGTNPDHAAAMIKKDPRLLNRLVYSVAVIKETLRLFPAASSFRAGNKETFFDIEGKRIPTEGKAVWIISHTLGRRADLFPSPDSFHPGRFLSPKTVPDGAWRPFERGPRNCIGQELAMLEMKIIMVLTLRKFEVTAAYDEYDRMKGRKKGGAVREAFGERAYQTLVASAKPSDGMPARVRKIGKW